MNNNTNNSVDIPRHTELKQVIHELTYKFDNALAHGCEVQDLKRKANGEFYNYEITFKDFPGRKTHQDVIPIFCVKDKLSGKVLQKLSRGCRIFDEETAWRDMKDISKQESVDFKLVISEAPALLEPIPDVPPPPFKAAESNLGFFFRKFQNDTKDKIGIVLNRLGL